MYYSFIMLKPDALERNLVSKIVDKIKVLDVNIEIFDNRRVDEELIFAHYHDVIERVGVIFKEMAKKTFKNKHVIPLIVSSHDENIISEIRKVIGDTDPSKALSGTIRGEFGDDSLENSMKEVRCCNNLIHASDSKESYLFESELWFGKEIACKFR